MDYLKRLFTIARDLIHCIKNHYKYSYKLIGATNVGGLYSFYSCSTGNYKLLIYDDELEEYFLLEDNIETFKDLVVKADETPWRLR